MILFSIALFSAIKFILMLLWPSPSKKREEFGTALVSRRKPQDIVKKSQETCLVIKRREL